MFVDTSAWYAAADTKDSNNQAAKRILSDGEQLVTTDLVLVETWLLMSRRLGFQVAERYWEELRRGIVRLETVTSADFDSAWSIGRDFPNASFSIVDRTSFSVMQRLRIERVAAFDHHFAIYRYGPKKDRAFEVLS